VQGAIQERVSLQLELHILVSHQGANRFIGEQLGAVDTFVHDHLSPTAHCPTAQLLDGRPWCMILRSALTTWLSTLGHTRHRGVRPAARRDRWDTESQLGDCGLGDYKERLTHRSRMRSS